MCKIYCHGLKSISDKEIEELSKIPITDEKYEKLHGCVVNTYNAETDRIKVQVEAIDQDERRRIAEEQYKAELKDHRNQRILEYVKVGAETGVKLSVVIILASVFGNTFNIEEFGTVTTKNFGPALNLAMKCIKL